MLKHQQLISFIGICLVVFIHATTSRFCDGSTGAEFASQVESFVAHGVARVAVPVFFFLAGYRFFFGVTCRPELFPKVYKRIRTLLVPYLIWSGLWLSIAVIAGNLNPDGFGLPFKSKLTTETANFGSILYIWLLNPIPGQLWFLRDLISLVIISPLILSSLKVLGPSLCITFGIIWTIVPDHVVITNREWWEFVSITSLLWFTVGAYFATTQKNIKSYGPATLFMLCCTWFTVIYLRLFGNLCWPQLTSPGVQLLLDRMSIFIGLPVLLSISARLDHLTDTWPVNRLCQYSFFIFCAHYPFLGFAGDFYFRYADCGTWWRLSAFFGLPIATIAGCWLVGELLNHRFSKLYSLLSGGRGSADSFRKVSV